MRVDWCVSSWFRIKNNSLNTQSLTHSLVASHCFQNLYLDAGRHEAPRLCNSRRSKR